MALMPQVDLVLAIGLYAQAWHLGAGAGALADRDGDGLARASGASTDAAARPAAAASVLAQHRLAEAQSLVRERNCCRFCKRKSAIAFRLRSGANAVPDLRAIVENFFLAKAGCISCENR